MTLSLAFSDPLALVGMDAAWAGCGSLSDFERMVYAMDARYAVDSVNVDATGTNAG